jgi:hypothetical protein
LLSFLVKDDNESGSFCLLDIGVDVVTEGKTQDETCHDEVDAVDEDHDDLACEESEEEPHFASYAPFSTSSFGFGTKS